VVNNSVFNLSIPIKPFVDRKIDRFWTDSSSTSASWTADGIQQDVAVRIRLHLQSLIPRIPRILRLFNRETPKLLNSEILKLISVPKRLQKRFEPGQVRLEIFLIIPPRQPPS